MPFHTEQSSLSRGPHYAGRQFFLPPVSNVRRLPFGTFTRFRNWRRVVGMSLLEDLPLELLTNIFQYLLQDPEDLIRLSRVSTQILRAIMQPDLVLHDDHTVQWFPFLQMMHESVEELRRTFLDNKFVERGEMLQQRGVRTSGFLEQLNRNNETELTPRVRLAIISESEIERGIGYIKEVESASARQRCLRSISGAGFRGLAMRALLCNVIVALSVYMPLYFTKTIDDGVGAKISVGVATILLSFICCFYPAYLSCMLVNNCGDSISLPEENPFPEFAAQRATWQAINDDSDDDVDAASPLLS